MARPLPARLSEEQEELAYELMLEGTKKTDIAKKLGFKNKYAIFRYEKRFPDFSKTLEEACIESCKYMEEQMLEAPLKYDSRTAEALIKAIERVLRYRYPKRYGDRIDMNVTQTIDISGALERSERRVIEVLATNVVPMIKTKQEEDNSSTEE